jgi:predicted GNAT family acetyltransferase
MNLRVYDKAQELLEDGAEYLERREAENNLPLGILYRLARDEQQGKEEGRPLLVAVEDADDLTVVAVMTPPRNLLLSTVERATEESLRLIAEYLREARMDPPGVIGPAATAAAFSSAWESLSGCRAEVAMRQRVYELRQVNNLKLTSGQLRKAMAEEAELLSSWIYNFSEAITEPVDCSEALKLAQRRIGESSLYIWEDGGPVSMANKGRHSRNGVVVNMVYTPPEYRNRGYATACVLSLSRLLLEEGYRFCSLYTDLANPTSNRIYATIGYKPVGDSLMYKFVGRP